MIDPLSLIVGAIITASAYGAGRTRGFVAGKKKARAELNAPPEPVCSCKHGPGMHVDKVGKCKFSRWDDWESREYTCPCQNYDGPEPLPQYFAPPITGS